jgi:Flp pilus assembly protein TadD
MNLFVALLASALCVGQASAPVDRILERGNAALAAGRFTDAESAFNHALVLAPDNREAQVQLGIVYLLTERFVQARLLFRSAGDAAPDDAAMQLRIGAAYVQAAQLSEAEP